MRHDHGIIPRDNRDADKELWICRQANGSQNELFKKYLVEMADHIDPNRDSDMSSKC